MKVIFLDVDGVLNSMTTAEREHGFVGIQPSKVKMFNEIIEKTGAKVVLSSFWRLHDDWEETMKKNGLVCEFLGRTPHFPGLARGLEIKDWLDTQAIKSDFVVEKYAIVDDDPNMLPGQPLFKTSFSTGLTEDVAESVTLYLTTP